MILTDTAHTSETLSNLPHELAYGFGKSSLGDFIVATDAGEICAIMLGDDRGDLLDQLRASFPGDTFLLGGQYGYYDIVEGAVARLIEDPTTHFAFSIAVPGGDFANMTRAALNATPPGATITPDEVAARIGASPGSSRFVRACAATDLVAVAVPFHRLQEADGANPSYRWGEERRQTLLARERAGAAARDASSI